VTDEMRQKIVMLCIEKLCVGEPTVISKLPAVLNALYDAEVLDEGNLFMNQLILNTLCLTWVNLFLCACNLIGSFAFFRYTP